MKLLKIENTFAPSALGWASLGFFPCDCWYFQHLKACYYTKHICSFFLWLLIFATFEHMLLHCTHCEFFNICTYVITLCTLLLFAHIVHILLHRTHCELFNICAHVITLYTFANENPGLTVPVIKRLLLQFNGYCGSSSTKSPTYKETQKMYIWNLWRI